MSDDTAAHGTCQPGFERIRDEFIKNFTERGEVGAAVCVLVDGVAVVDLWGGVADATTGRGWERDTPVVIQSSSKGVTAMCAHVLIDQGELNVDRPVADYWPEFAANGKSSIPVRQVMNHQSGVAHVDGHVPAGGFNDWELMIGLIEGTTPFWTPGTRVGYHGMTHGWLIGELVRRISGRSVGTFFREHIGDRLDLDCWIGLPTERHAGVARSLAWDTAGLLGMPPKVYASFVDRSTLLHKSIAAALRIPPVRSLAARQAVQKLGASGLPPAFVADTLNPNSAAFKLMTNMAGWSDDFDNSAAYSAEIPAGGAIATARGLAGAYAPFSLDGEHRGVRVVSEGALARMSLTQSATDVDAVLGQRTAYSLGFSKSWPNQAAGNGVFIGRDAFGTPGRGGSIGFADPSARLAFAYVMNRHGMGAGLNERGQSLVDAAYRCLGDSDRGSGAGAASRGAIWSRG